MTTKYLIDNDEVTETEFWERLEEEVRCEVEAHLDDMIDECYDEVKIGCMTFYPSQILEKCDPIAYSMIGDDFVDSRLSDFKYDLERGESVDVGPYTFEIIEDDEFDVVEEDEVEEEDGNVVVHVYNSDDELVASARVKSEDEVKEALNKFDFCAGDTIEIEKEN